MILLVEDQPLLAMLAQSALEEAGYEVALATNGEHALEALDSGLKLTALVTDIRLGRGPNGWQLAQQARRHDPALHVIYMSGDPEQDSTCAVPRSVMLSKPLNILHLLRAIRAVELSGGLRD